VQRFEGSWPQASLSIKDLRWARENLVKGADGNCAFERGPRFSRDSLTNFPPPILPESWNSRVDFKRDKAHPDVLVQMGKRYDFRAKFDQAQAERDPELAPHVMFLKLSHGNEASALGFIQECGPLFLNDMTRDAIIWVDLDDFWKRHARFVAVVRLFETMNDCENLRKALIHISENIASLNTAGEQELGMIPHSHENMPFIRSVVIYSPREFRKVDQDGDPVWHHKLLRQHAREILWAELTLQTNDGLRSGWEMVDEEEGMGFRPTRIVTSLWAAMWEMVGLETWRGYSWRSCRECGKYFYPLQSNSECCTPKHQTLWSKREYARRSRESQKLRAPDRRQKRRS
jgi:hypothetical protein